MPGARRELKVAGIVVIAAMGLNLIAASIGVPLLRYLFPARVLAEAAGMLAAFALIARLRPPDVSPALRQALAGFVVLLALGWGGWQTKLGSDEATLAAVDRGLPNADTMDALAEQLRSEVPSGEAVMSNLGPNLAWVARRPVVHLALTPADVDACRRRLDFHHMLVVFRDASKAWPGWTELVAHPGDAPNHPEWNIPAGAQHDRRRLGGSGSARPLAP
jgi:hypothetical protein